MPLRTFGQVEVNRVTPDSSQPRSEFDEEEITRLASSIQSMGQLHPIRVRWDAEAGIWVIVTGERRWRATKAAGLTHIDCYFHEGDITPSEILEQQLVENLLREGLKPMEEARGYISLMELNGWNRKQVADALRVSPSKVTRALALLELPDDIQERVQAGAITPTSAYELTKLANPAAQRRLAEEAASGLLTQKDTVDAVRKRRGKLAPRPRGIKQTFCDENGFRVTVSSKKKGTYYDIEHALVSALEEVRHRIANRVQLI
jgi:ParB family chromosome partitioning protein